MFRRFCHVVAVAAVLLVSERAALAASDPRILWQSLQTRHFRITYYSTEDAVAARVAAIAESIFDRLVAAVGWAPGELTEILLTDQTDTANGSAAALPYNAVRLYITAPDDMSPLGDVDDWYLELVTHEYTHILHTDHISGIPALINAILGKTSAPNQVQPHWLLEGLAVFEESARTTGGRLRSSMWNMFMRTDVLEHNVAPLDVFSNFPRRWPQGNIWYLYGSFFLKWVAETYGDQAIRDMIDDYSHQIVPFGINRSIRRATGKTFEELYPVWVDSLDRDFSAQAEAIRALGVREGIRLTHTGNTAEHPRWLPSAEATGDDPTLAYYVDDGHATAGYWSVPLVRDGNHEVVGAKENERDLLIRLSGVGGLTFLPSGASVFSSQDVLNNLFLFDDLFELPPGAKSPLGIEGNRVRWTEGFRAMDPSVSPDGRRVVFTTNHRGKTHLMIADIEGSSQRAGQHAISNVRPLVLTGEFDQAFTPRWAPDNRHVAYSSWRSGGYRDIRVVDTKDGSWSDITNDRAIDGDPCFSADGKWLYFHSDRTGVSNIYAYDVASGALKQVTNVISGAYQPEPSPDGKSLAYIGYTHDGYDLFVMSSNPDEWPDAPPYVDDRGPAPPIPPPVTLKPTAYNPWLTLVPRAYSLRLTPGNYGQASIASVSGSDIAGIHSFAASLTTEWESPDLQPSLSYTYSRLPFDMSASIYRQISPQSDYAIGSHVIPWKQETTGITTGIGYSVPGPFDGQSFALSYTYARYAGSLPLPVNLINPYDTPIRPSAGMLASLHLGWSYSNTQSYLWSVSSESGFNVGASFDWSDPAIASDVKGYAASANLGVYLPVPALQHHVLALHAGGGASGGNAAGRGLFFIGGFVDLPVIDVVRNLLIQGGIELRGYPVVAEAGNYYALLNTEYRFPIVNVDRGPSTLPLFLNRINGAFFSDYGSAFNSPSAARFKLGVGGEVWFDMTLGYILSFTFRAGYAKGVSSDGIDKTYFVAAVPF